jgi:single-strand selective monofunctional uracil DNA glycosylase
VAACRPRASAASRRLLAIADELVGGLRGLRFADPVAHVYDPLVHARAPYRRYLECYAGGRKEVVLLGMNPGPFGMLQTGVPFGEVALVRDWLGVEGRVEKPRRQHPRRPIEGFACGRSEVSGRRLWGWARDRFGTPGRFFERFFVLNYCPLVFLEESGRNRTPDKLPAKERERLFAPCDGALRASVDVLRPELVVGVGRFAERRARAVLADGGPRVGAIPHPSPASPAANRGWARQAEQALARLGVEVG